MLIFGDNRNKSLSDAVGKLLDHEVKYVDIRDFDDGEFRVRLDTKVLGEDVFVIRSFADPVERNLLEFLFIVDALTRSGASRVIAVCPYLPYMRADHVFRSGEAVPLEVFSQIFDGMGVERIWTIDPHSIKLPEMFSTPVDDADGMDIFASKIRALAPDMSQVSVVSPDMGGIRRIKILSEKLDGVPYVVVQKDRDLETGETVVASVEGEMRENVFLVDDIISTGGTMVQAAHSLLDMGAKRAYILATHPVFAPGAEKTLSDARIEHVIVGDSISVSGTRQFKNLEIISIAPLIAEYIKSQNF